MKMKPLMIAAALAAGLCASVSFAGCNTSNGTYTSVIAAQAAKKTMAVGITNLSKVKDGYFSFELRRLSDGASVYYTGERNLGKQGSGHTYWGTNVAVRAGAKYYVYGKSMYSQRLPFTLCVTP